MPSLFPSFKVLQQAFPGPGDAKSAPASSAATPRQARSELYVAYSVVDDAKSKAKKLSAEAQREFDKAAGAGKKLELYSGQYYAACTVGGLAACVRTSLLLCGGP